MMGEVLDGVLVVELGTMVTAPLAGMMLVQELLGPVVTQRALMAARETHLTHAEEPRHAA